MSKRVAEWALVEASRARYGALQAFKQGTAPWVDAPLKQAWVMAFKVPAISVTADALPVKT